MEPYKKQITDHYFTCQSFNSFFKNKGFLGAVAEKAKLNYEAKNRNAINRQSRLHYFAIGHAFKQMNTKLIFQYALDQDTQMELPTAFSALQIETFDFGTGDFDTLLKLIDGLRNINAHYLHDFENIKVTDINPRIIKFIREGFELALIQSCYKLEIQKEENERNTILSAEEKLEILEDVISPGNEFILINFIQKIFYQTLYTKKFSQLTDLQKQTKQFIDHFKTKAELVDWLLFKELKEDLLWSLNKDGDNSSGNHKHNMIIVPRGKYLSFEACLFLLTMFLYKTEANLLVPKLPGFKKNGNAQDESKLEVFRLFSKKFRSQDIDSAENQLTKFRDIIQYLSKYPLTWNHQLEKDDNPVSIELKDQIKKLELERLYPDFRNEEKFYLYAKEMLWGNGNFKIYDLNDEEIIPYEYEIFVNDEIKNCDDQLKKLQEKLEKNLYPEKKQKIENDIAKENKKINKIVEDGGEMFNRRTEKLKVKIARNTLYQTYGRNQDRFMDFALRFLAEHHYFGENALFKMYRFYSGIEEEQYLKENANNINLDKEKYHGGKLVYFDTFANHLSRYPEWDTPFVIENNAAYIKLPDINRIICLQRGLLIYLLEHALSKDSLKDSGSKLLFYYLQEKEKAFSDAAVVLQNQNSITTQQKTAFRKLLPRRLLNHYAPAVVNNENASALKAILDKAENMEQRYISLWQKAKDGRYLTEFEKKNKGKNFKLNFIRKAWNIMYFRDIYFNSKNASKQSEQNVEKQEHEKGHHKSHHITREEFNNFCRWMYAFDDAPHYKSYLLKLFEQKQFLSNTEFSKLFHQSLSLNDLYTRTKEKYKSWLNVERSNPEHSKYQFDNYKKLLYDGVIHINTSHFIEYLKQKRSIETNTDGSLKYVSLQNKSHLIESYYLNESYAKHTDKQIKKLFNELNLSKLEDCILYEIAIRYFNHQKESNTNVKNHILYILQQEILFTVNANHAGDYKIIVPFKDIDKYQQLIFRKGDRSLIEKLPEYLKEAKNEKSIKPVFEFYTNNDRSITISHINTLNSHLIKASAGFIKIIMALEEYYIWKQSLVLTSLNRLELENIPTLYDKYFNNDITIRNRSLHFNLPLGNNYHTTAKTFEKLFLKKETPAHISKYAELTNMQMQVTEVFLTQLHNEYFDRAGKQIKDPKKKAEQAKELYFSKTLKPILQHG